MCAFERDFGKVSAENQGRWHVSTVFGGTCYPKGDVQTAGQWDPCEAALAKRRS